TNSPAAIVVQGADGTPFTARSGWPAPLPSDPLGPPVVGPLGSASGPGVGFFQSGGLSGLGGRARPVGGFPQPGPARALPALDELDGDGATEIAAGTALADSNVYTYDAGAGSYAAGLVAWPTPRGDFARTASHATGAPGPFVIDRIRPAAITDLEA